jgi:hypothetical protein
MSAGCSKNEIVNGIVAKAKSCGANECILQIRSLTKFDWDELYVFDSSVSPEIVEDAIKTKYEKYMEFTRPIIFTLKGKIMYSENDPVDIEGVLNNEVIFNYPDSVKYQVYNHGNAIFKIKKMNSGQKVFYKLIQANNY